MDDRTAPGGFKHGLVAAVIPSVCYASVLFVGVPAELDRATSRVFAGVVTVLGALLVTTFWHRSFLARLACSTLVLTLFAIPLSALWQSGRSDGSVIGGLLPFSDADGYYQCARVLAEGESFRSSPEAVLCSQRPMATTVLGGLLAVTGQDLRWSLALLTLMTAVSCFVAASELRASHGAIAATLVLLLLFFFHRGLTGKTLTEHVGLSLGAASFAALWRAARASDFKMCLTGVFLKTLALMARAGAFFTLPALAVWGAVPSGRSRLLSWRRLGLGCGVIVLGFGLNALHVRAIGVPAAAFGNFSLVLYGLVYGGTYKLALEQHPELGALDPIEQYGRVMTLALDGIRAEPARLVRGAVRAWKQFLGTGCFYGYVPSRTAVTLLIALTVAGLVRCFVRRRDAWASLLLAMTLAAFLSIPFMPPWDVDVRVYAATLPFLCALPAVGLAGILDRLPSRRFSIASTPAAASSALWTLAAGLLALAYVVPSTAAMLATRPRFASVASSPCGEPVVMRAPVGAMIRVLRSDASERRYPTELRQNEFRRGLRRFREEYTGLGDELAVARAPFILFNALGLEPFQRFYIVAGTQLLTPDVLEARFWRICVKPAKDATAQRYGLHYATAIQPASPVSEP